MSATAVTAHELTLTVGGVELACQLTGFTLSYADDTGEKIYTACPGGVVTVPGADGSVATLTVSLLHDWSATGASWKLAELTDRTGVAFTLNADTDKPTQARTYTGTLDLPRVPEDWQTRGLQRVELTLPVTAITGPTRYVAP